MRKSLLVLSGVLFVSSVQAASLSGIVDSDQWQQVKENSLSLKTTQFEYDQALLDLDIDMLDKLSITADAETKVYLEDDARSDDEVVVSVDVDQEITSKLIVGATVDTDERASLTASYKPFADDWVTPALQYAFDQAEVELSYAEITLFDEFQSALLTLLVAEKELSYSLSDLKRSEQYYDSLAKASSIDDISTEDLSDAQSDVIEAKQAVLNNKMALAEAKLELSQLSGQDTAEYDLPDAVTLESLVQKRNSQLLKVNKADVVSQDIDLLTAELRYLENVADNIDVYDSDLTFTSSYDIDDVALTAGVSVNLSPSQWNHSEIADAEVEVNLKTTELLQEKAFLELNVELQNQKVTVAHDSVESAKLGLETQQLLLKEAQYLFELGERTGLEVFQQQVAVEEAELNYSHALVDLFEEQQSLSRYFQ